jgi:hypothetical protein
MKQSWTEVELDEATEFFDPLKLDEERVRRGNVRTLSGRASA